MVMARWSVIATVSEDAALSPSSPPTNKAFAAVLLAGGNSARMGRDKAGIHFRGEELWRRQLATLRALNPRELFISGRITAPYAGGGIEIVPDLTPARGPLSGLEASLVRATSRLVLVLAIDLPLMTAGFLARLLNVATASGTGVVPRTGERFEPLAAIYSRECLSLVRRGLESDDFSMQNFARKAVGERLLTPLELAPEESPLFRNLNTPADLRASGLGE